MVWLPDALLEISLLLTIAVLIGLFSQRARIPPTVVLAVAGILVVALGGQLSITRLLEGEGFEFVLVHLFLPILVFEAALGLSTRVFLRNLLAISALASVALVLAAAMIGASLHVLLAIPLAAALLLGVITSATDPVAVVAVFRELGVPKRLLTLVEGESLLNDGVAIVLAQVLVVLALRGRMTVGEAVLDFVLVFFGGALVGLVIGSVAALILPVIRRLPAATLSIAVAYGSFVLTEEIFGFSGVMATLMAGVVLGGLLDSRADPTVRTLLHELWGALSYIANALLFLFIGLAIDLELLVGNWVAVVVAIVAALVARPLAVIPVVKALERTAHIPRIGPASSAVLVWGGLRGGVALALALALPESLPQRELFIAMTAGVVLTTLLVNATTMGPLIRALGLDQPDDQERYLDALARLVAVEAVRTHLEELGFDDELVVAHLAVAAADARDQLGRARLTPEEEVRLLTMRGLNMERETYQDLSDAGLLPPIATRTLQQEIDDELDELQFGSLQVDAARRAQLGWVGRFQRRTLALLPPPIGENLTDVGYVEVAARHLASMRAARELDQFKSFPEVDETSVERAQQTFLHWERAAARTLSELGQRDDIDELTLRRRQAKAVGRMSTAEVLRELVDRGMLPAAVAAKAEERIAGAIDQIGS